MSAAKRKSVFSDSVLIMFVPGILLLLAGKIAFSLLAVGISRALELNLAMREPGLLSDVSGHIWVMIFLAIIAASAPWINRSCPEPTGEPSVPGRKQPWQRIDRVQHILAALFLPFLLIDNDLTKDVVQLFEFYGPNTPAFLPPVYQSIYIALVVLLSYIAIHRLRAPTVWTDRDTPLPPRRQSE